MATAPADSKIVTPDGRLTPPWQAYFGQGNTRTAAEIAAGVTPVNYAWPELWVERYGADPTGTNDSGGAFRAACSVAAQKGGGIIRAYGALYNFTTWDTVSFYAANNLALFNLPANTELAGGGMFFTKLRISQTARTGMYAAGANRTHIIGMKKSTGGQYVHDLEFDYNGIVQAAANDFCYFVRTCSGSCIIERCYGVQGPITNGIVDSSTDTANGNSPLGPTVVRECWFQDCGPNMGGNGVNADLSYIYLSAPGSKAERNRFYNTAIASHNCGGIEMHASQYYVTENYIKNCWPGMYLGVEDGVTISIGSVVEKNYIGYCNSGIQLVDRHYGLKIVNNHFEANCDSAGDGFGYLFTDLFTPLNATTGANGAGVQTALEVTNNTFDCTNYRQGTARSTAGAAGQSTASVNISALLGARIKNNDFIQATPNCLWINGSTTAPAQDVLVEENSFVGCNDAAGTVAYVTVYMSSVATYGSGPVAQSVYVRSNHFWRSTSYATSTAFCGLVASGGAGPSGALNDVRFYDNDVVKVNATVDNVSLQATDTVYINGVNQQAQAIIGNGATIVVPSLMKSTVIATPNNNYTGIIMQPGVFDGQECTVIVPAFALTMAAAGTSHVADGVSCVINAALDMTFTWAAASGNWFHR